MALFSALAIAVGVAGLGLSAYGMVQQQHAQQQQAAAQAQALAFQQQAERTRKRAMDLDAARRRREMIRNAITARSTSESVATAQGAGFGSGLPGAYGGISGRTGVNTQGVNQNQELAGDIFASNAGASGAYRSAAAAGSEASMWGGLTSLGGMILNNTMTIAKVGSYFGGGTTANFSPNTSAGAVY